MVESDNSYFDSRDNCNAIIESSTNKLIVGCMNTNIPNGVSSIGDNAFKECFGLTSITIPNSVTSIGNNAFEKCYGLTSIIIPNSVTYIGNNAFYATGWYNNQPNGLIYAGRVAYKYKGEMPEGTEIVLKENTTGISNEAFINCSNLQSVIIPNNVIYIGDYSFSGCNRLSIVSIPNSVTKIGKEAFYGCTGLKNLILGKGVSYIGEYAFYACNNLTATFSYSIDPPSCHVYNHPFSITIDDNVVLWIPHSCIEKYKTAVGWNEFNDFRTIGDVNDDNTVNAIDIVEVVNYINGSHSNNFNLYASDMNNDGVIDKTDINMILNTIFLTKYSEVK